MNDRPIIDAGPALNFCSINKERLLIGTLGPLSAPETVANEVMRKARTDSRFCAAEAVWQKLTPRWIHILPDEPTSDLAAVVQRISGLPMVERKRQASDLGEIMVVAHAVVAAEAGATATILIDDEGGARIANTEKSRLERVRKQGRPAGAIRLVNTLSVLERAAGGEHLAHRGDMRSTYDRLRRLDDGLPPIESTNLLSRAVWS